MKIVPAILSETFSGFLFFLRQAESFAEYVQIDLMDGVFVPTLSFSGEKINNIRTSVPFELHIMVKHPAAYMAKIQHHQLRKVVFHIESDVKHHEFIQQMNQRGIKTGLAIKPETGTNTFRQIAEHVDTLMFMTVEPGYSGNIFRGEVLNKIREARNIFQDKVIAVDGGVSLENLSLFSDAGVDYVCVGSRIFDGNSPEKNYRIFVEKLGELEGDQS